MDVIPPEYDEATKERVYRQEWLEHFHYIGYEAALRDFPAQYHALFPHGHQRPPMRPVQVPTAGPAGEPPQQQQQQRAENDRAVPATSATAPTGSSALTNTQEGARRPAEAERRDGRELRSDRERRPHSSRRDDDDDHERSRRHHHHRHRSDSERRSDRGHHRSSRDDGQYGGNSSSGSRRRRRSDEREERRVRHSSSHDDDSRRSRREGDIGSSRSRAYEERREDALRRRAPNYRR
ncbi:splicing factor PTSR1 interacting protein [Leptomonas pyrrhocoris]|uniref:Splicing factor PTSR1 interacting protein n=1 Tax=Leptomonas pyrrhocoris TaxID=157538 RepID=A0A0M9G449_LEPPY|nr:splicing factor PTSR1 interacting protein [Leptomonas pyrrhocoris]KPA82050.1 splicing factor PTSR1 interacting protein [Leptomonas pyrrhocoris]|eukprot:XP_015660489.1 splicing factor PTSR1 interacting protein [Leptomonas pyrrhocoris]